jgi:hypothetical protein
MADWPNLTRYWCPRGETFEVDASGYLGDPEDASRANPRLVTSPALRRAGCRVLLGEPGMGKTHAVTRLRATLPVERTLFVDLAGVVSPDELRHRLFASPDWAAWRDGHWLHVVLDSFDESVVSLPRGVQVLRTGLAELPHVDRLTLTIASRSGAWPPTLEEALAARWRRRLGVYELCPLRRRDVEAVLRAEVIDAGAFFGGLDRADSHVLAARPQTLLLLVRVFRRSGSLPADRQELYERATLALCEEPNPLFRESGRRGTLTPSQRQALAGRVAAVTVLCGRRGVWSGPESERPDDLVGLSDLVGGDERAADTPFAVTLEGVREVLRDTALFNSADGQTVAWAHRSYAEFLTARQLADRNVAAPQIDNLFLHPSGRGVVPQLVAAAGWAGRYRPEWFRSLAGRDPAVLFGTDPTLADDAFKGWAAEQLLRAADENRLHDRDLRDRDYRRFGHVGLPDRLRPWVTDRTRGFIARRMAFDMAAANGIRGVQSELLAVALDRDEDRNLRRFAARAVAKVGGRDTRLGLRGLLSVPVDQDPDDDLLAVALDGLWPELIPTPEMFGALRRPRRSDLFASYHRFICYTLPQRLAPGDLPVALDWLTTFADYETHLRFGRLQTRLVSDGWDRSDEPEVRAALARAVWHLVRHHWPLLERHARDEVASVVLADTARRQRILDDILPLATSTTDGGGLLVYSRVIWPEDAGWLVGQLRTTETVELRRTLALAAGVLYLYHPADPAVSEPLLLAYRSSPCEELRDALAPLLAPVSLRSPEADQLRGTHARHSDWARERDQPAAEEPTPQERLRAALASIRGGRADSWPALTRDLFLEPLGSMPVSLFKLDLSPLPGWQALEATDRPHVGRAAERFVRSHDPRQPDDSSGLALLAGVKALHLLRTRARRRFQRLPRRVWRRWLPMIVGYPAGGHSETDRQALFVAAYQACPNAARRALIRQVREEDRRRRSEDLARLAIPVWDRATAEGLRGLLTRTRLRPRTFGQVLTLLAERGDEQCVSLARARLGDSNNPSARVLLQRFEVATALMRYDGDAFWPLLEEVNARRPEFVRGWLKYLAKHEPGSEFGRWVAGRTPVQIGQLFRWVMTHFPPPTDPRDDNDGWQRPRDRVTNWRRDLLTLLGQAGTIEALGVLEQVAAEYPGVDHIEWRLIDARADVLGRSWQPPRPGDLLRLLRDDRSRLVRTADELMAVLVESLGRYGQELQGASPSAFQLWDDAGSGRLRPKNENRLSDSVALHLRRDLVGRGVVLNREVEIRPRHGAGGNPGERTDIQVDAVGVDAGTGRVTTVTVIIEVKGSWHPDVRTAMVTQLRDRYLADNHCSHGLYLVGWYRCQQWDPGDPRNADDRRHHPGDLVATRAMFEAQATANSGGRFRLASYVLNAALR